MTPEVADPALIDEIPGHVVRVYSTGRVQITLQNKAQWYGLVAWDARGIWVAREEGTTHRGVSTTRRDRKRVVGLARTWTRQSHQERDVATRHYPSHDEFLAACRAIVAGDVAREQNK
jgi:hypothetical protein